MADDDEQMDDDLTMEEAMAAEAAGVAAATEAPDLDDGSEQIYLCT